MTTRRPRAAAIREIGATIDEKYQLLGLIGAGSTGDVFRATHLADGVTVALKVLDPALSRDERQVERFRREASVCIRLHHPHTVRVLDYGRFIDGRLFLAMEHLDGLTLAETLRRRRPLGVARACHVARQVAEALAEAHGNDIVHRDIKPDNIFLARVGGAVDFVKILDFGIARFVGDGAVQQTLTRTGFVAGTPLYLSPEQGLGKRLDGRSDLYSLGVVLYEMVVGRPPFVAETPVALVLKHIHETPPPPIGLNPGVELPAPLDELLRALLAKNRDHRPRDAHAVALLLEEIESIAAAQAVDEPPAPQSGGVERDRMARLHALPLADGGRLPDGAFASDEEAFQELAALLRKALDDVDDGDEAEAAARQGVLPGLVPVPHGEDVAPGSPELPVVVLEHGEPWTAEPPGEPRDDHDGERPDEPDDPEDLPFVPDEAREPGPGDAEPDRPAPAAPRRSAAGAASAVASAADEAPASEPWAPAPPPTAAPERRPNGVPVAAPAPFEGDLPPEEPPAESRGPLVAVLLLLLVIAGLLALWFFSS
jgi:serine/threonine-protein kinase